MKRYFKQMANKYIMPKSMYLRILKRIYRELGIEGEKNEIKKRRN